MLTLDSYINKPLEIQKELLILLGNTKKPVIFDIGACEGEDAIRYASLFVNGEVYAFEPRPDNLKKIADTFSKYKRSNVQVFPYALSDSNGTATFYLSSGQPEEAAEHPEWDFGNKSSSLLAPSEEMSKHYSWLKFDSQIEVETHRLDAFCKEKKLDHIDFIHLDVQGAELLVLAGAGDLLSKLSAIWLEVERIALYSSQPVKSDIEKFMEARGFVQMISSVNDVAGDQLYVNTAIVPKSVIKRLQDLQKRKEWTARLKKIYGRIRKPFGYVL
jgi:FkbM family methyltransferase